MKKKALLGLSLITVLTMLILPASASSVWFRANGKVISYYPYDPSNPGSAMVVGGNWNLQQRSDPKNPDNFLGIVSFQLNYRELNLGPEENAPVGTVDHFCITLVQLDWVDVIDERTFIVYGSFNIDKLAWLPEGSTPRIDHIYNFDTADGTVTIIRDISGLGEDQMHFEAYSTTKPWHWHLIGSVTSVKGW